MELAQDRENSSPNALTPMLQVSNLNVYYGESHILRNVDLSIFAGQMVCLIGRNGVGKTTLLKTIMGLLKPRTGTVVFQEKSIVKETTDRREWGLVMSRKGEKLSLA
jgi:ABC-type branched-subunit amino acid transport system ATPase component